MPVLTFKCHCILRQSKKHLSADRPFTVESILTHQQDDKSSDCGCLTEESQDQGVENVYDQPVSVGTGMHFKSKSVPFF